MKILKVIVDELPEGCKDCQFLHTWERWRSVLLDCDATFEGFIEDLDTKPDWCPLEVEQVEEMLGIDSEDT